MLPLKDEIGGLRMLYSQNVQFPMSQVHGLPQHDQDRSSLVSKAILRRPTKAPEYTFYALDVTSIDEIA